MLTGYYKPMIFDRTKFIEKNVVETLKIVDSNSTNGMVIFLLYCTIVKARRFQDEFRKNR